MTGDYIYNQITLRFPVSDFIAEKKKEKQTAVWYLFGSTLMMIWDFLGKNGEKEEDLRKNIGQKVQLIKIFAER